MTMTYLLVLGFKAARIKLETAVSAVWCPTCGPLHHLMSPLYIFMNLFYFITELEIDLGNMLAIDTNQLDNQKLSDR